jgi:ABC-2 type transport system ATP-binding protein
MPDSNHAIVAKHVAKTFRLPHERNSGLKQAIVTFHKRNRGFELQRALADISLDIRKGEFFGIVGRNGSGKSTLLKLLAGVYVPNSGTIQTNGTLTPFIELGVGFNPELTGRENVYLNGALLGFNHKQMEDMYEDIVEFAELERFMDQKLKNYSSGMQVRLAFSIAIRAKSDILLIDEVLAVGDAAFQAKCFKYFRELKRKGTTVVFVSHDLPSLERFCDRGALIEGGEIVSEGDIRKVLKAYKRIVLKELEEPSAQSDSSVPGEAAPNTVATIKNLRTVKDDGKPSTKFQFGERISVVFDIIFKKPATNPVFGINIWQDGISRPLFATNTLIDRKDKATGDYSPGEAVEFKVLLPPDMNDGEYRVDPAVVDATTTVTLGSVQRQHEFTILGSNNPYSLLNSDEQIELVRSNDGK